MGQHTTDQTSWAMSVAGRMVFVMTAMDEDGVTVVTMSDPETDVVLATGSRNRAGEYGVWH